MTILDATGTAVKGAEAEIDFLSVDQLQDSLSESNQRSGATVGVRLAVEDSVDSIAALTSKLDVIELTFPHFKDGRPFSTAVLLRRDYGFEGDLRAAGDFLPDQVIFLLRSGFTSFVVPEQFSVAQFQSSLAAYSVVYQPAPVDVASDSFEVIGHSRDYGSGSVAP